MEKNIQMVDKLIKLLQKIDNIPFFNFSYYYGFAMNENLNNIENINELRRLLYSKSVVCSSFQQEQQLASMRLRLMEILKESRER